MTSNQTSRDQEQLSPEDFPLHADKDKIKRQDGQPVAQTESDGLAEEIAERLNSDEHHREEDKWSA
jgi:hypothetical protein